MLFQDEVYRYTPLNCYRSRYKTFENLSNLEINWIDTKLSCSIFDLRERVFQIFIYHYFKTRLDIDLNWYIVLIYKLLGKTLKIFRVEIFVRQINWIDIVFESSEFSKYLFTTERNKNRSINDKLNCYQFFQFIRNSTKNNVHIFPRCWSITSPAE